ncbi:MAG TPA: hypothetical protein VNJ54_04160 [Plantibacter sp.]|uniref:hypothetical protein n=1 Tax=unclassified Plantibacter TaxID=2624265 RepID=UPI002B91DACE|nr:hypothetical protein [Plantibacter sp.]
MRRSALPTLVLSALAVTIALAGCSAGGTASSSASPPDYAAEFDAYTLELASCMRDQGVDVEDPTPGNTISLDGSDATNAAYDTCEGIVGLPPVNPDQPSKEEISDELRLRAQCLRDKGFDVPDPAADGSWDLPEDLFDEARACAVQ